MSIFGHDDRELLKEILHVQECTLVLLSELLHEVRKHFHPEVTGFQIFQSGASMAVTGVPVGGTGTFTATPSPSGATLPAGNVPTWTADNPLVTLTPAADGLSVTAALDPTITGTSFNLRIDAQFTGADGNQKNVSGETPVPIIAATPPPPPEVTGFVIDQTA